MTLPPLWLVLPIVVGAGVLYLGGVAFLMRSQGHPLPIPAWWSALPATRRWLAYAAVAAELVAASVLLWSLEPGHTLPDAARVARGLTSLAATLALGWVAVSAWRGRTP